ncbi:LGFP repeat-containing protein [Microbacterium sp. PMB16]|uniref:LGFP repeat-containing protein n=1 Tax=Microbacterium sp. PMB16 TaxID=3120157 RepID=UPI003F4C7B51
MSRRAPRSRNTLRIARLLTCFLAASALVVGTVVPATAAAASVSAPSSAVAARTAADPAAAGIVKSSLAGFNAGNLISDVVFTNKSTMTEAQIQSFFNSKVARCLGGRDEDGKAIVCLKDFKITSVTRPADAYCSGYKGAANESAARIIYRVAQACNINPQVLIVMLQKEQGLITHTWPSAWRFNIALGQGCPDTAPCDPNYIGFFHQIYGAARQMQIYMEGKWFQWYAPGKTWNILYNPKASCGSSPVRVANKATSALYYYTPYQPNAAALRAGYGEGDGCSAYGNRNFYNYFTDWFGATKHTVSGAIAVAWNAQGGATGRYGQPTGDAVYVAANGGGYVQQFQKGTIWKPASSSHAYPMSTGAFRANYLAAGGEKGSWGWPTRDAECQLASSGCKMTFQKGTTYYSATTGSVLVPTAFAALYETLGAEASRFGYPTKAAIAGPDAGFEQTFQKGVIAYSPATRLVEVSGPFLTFWRAAGGVKSAYGYPKGAVLDVAANGGGQVQEYTKGKIWSSSAGAFGIRSGGMLTDYLAAGGEAGSWGWPTTAEKCGLSGGGCTMGFQKGTAAWSAGTGTVLMTASIAAEWTRYGGAARLGYPSSPATAVAANGGGTVQAFSKGKVYESAAGAFGIGSGAFLRGYEAAGGPQGAAWGWPTSVVDCTLAGGGCSMGFQKGVVAWSATTGSVLMKPKTAAEWVRYGGAARLGYPSGAATAVAANGGGTVQAFSKGKVYESAAGAFGIGSGAFLRGYEAAGGPQGAAWGWPTSVVDCTLAGGGCSMGFQKGVVAWSATTGSVLMKPKTAAEWVRYGGAARLGYPSGAATAVAANGGGTVQAFSKGKVYESAAGAFGIGSGAFLRGYEAAGGPQGAAWGWPTSVVDCTLAGGGCSMGFQKGVVAWSATTGSVLMPTGPILAEWRRLGGAASTLGYPSARPEVVGTVTSQRFQHGVMSYDTKTGKVTVK